MSIKNFFVKRRYSLHETKESTSPIIRNLNLTQNFDTTIRFFGDSNVSSTSSVTWPVAVEWPFTTTDEIAEYQSTELPNKLNNTNLPIDATSIEKSPWIAIEIFNEDLPVTCAAYENYPLWSPARILTGFTIPALETANPVFEQANLTFRVLSQHNWPAGGLTAEIFIAEEGTDHTACWNYKSLDPLSSWDSSRLLPNPFNGTNYGGHGAGSQESGSSGGGSILSSLVNVGSGLQFSIPSGLQENDIIEVDVSELLSNSGLDFTQDNNVVFLIRASYWNGTKPHATGEPVPDCSPVYYSLKNCADPNIIYYLEKESFDAACQQSGYALLQPYVGGIYRIGSCYEVNTILEQSIPPDATTVYDSSLTVLWSLIMSPQFVSINTPNSERCENTTCVPDDPNGIDPWTRNIIESNGLDTGSLDGVSIG